MHDISEGQRFRMVDGLIGRIGFPCVEQEHILAITELVKQGVYVVCDDPRCHQLELGQRFEGVRLYVNDRCDAVLDLELVERAPRVEGGEWLFARVTNDRSAAALWQTIHRTHSIHAAPLEEGEIDFNNLPKIPGRGLYTEEARQERLAYLRHNTPSKLEHVAKTSFEARKLISNVENFIGSLELPVGVAGPLLIKGENLHGMYYAPLATSEGALVASATRGATVITRSGGVSTRVTRQRMLRVPCFVLENIEQASFFANWVRHHFDEIRGQVSKFSNYANLNYCAPQVFGKIVHLHFVYETGDAAGQNMTTTCTWKICQWILEQMRHFEHIRFENFLIEANLSNDKKVTYQSFLRGRGIAVVAEALLPGEHLEQVLKVTPRQLVEAYQAFVTGSIAAGMIGLNINIANVIGAMFTACGQDIACVHESAIGQLHVELADEGRAVYTSLTLPSLVVGTVGGGTWLPHQKNCLEMLGCSGPGNARKFAEVVAGFCLALDLSTLSAIASGQFASAHERLGRNRPVHYVKLGDLDADFFGAGLRERLDDPSLAVRRAEEIVETNKGSSIITELTAHKVNKLVGHFPFHLEVSGRDGARELDVMVKVKPSDAEVIMMLNSMAQMCDPRLAQEYSRFKDKTGFANCHIRELAVMSQRDPRFTRHAPMVYRAWRDDSREAYVLVEEKLTDMVLMDTADDTSAWQREHIFAALDGLADIHAIWYGREDELRAQSWLGEPPSRERRVEMSRLWDLLGVHAFNEFPEWFSEKALVKYQALVQDIGNWWTFLDAQPKTLIHNDFNPRNVCLRRDGDGLRLCAYDWELATMHLPQYDLAEFLTFTLQPDADGELIDACIERHRAALAAATGTEIDPSIWREGYRWCLADLMVGRLSMYVMAHTFRHYDFMARVQRTFRHLWLHEESQS